MPHASPRVFLVVDPVQGYEETMRVLGVHGSLAAAQVAARVYRSRVIPPSTPGGFPWRVVQPSRDLEVQLWRGDELLDTWTHHGTDSSRAGRWSHGTVPR